MKVETIQSSKELDALNKHRFRDNIVYMLREQYTEYVLPAAEALGHLFGTFLEAELEMHVAFDDMKTIPDKWARLFKALAGPHGKTILKMYQINKEVPDES